MLSAIIDCFQLDEEDNRFCVEDAKEFMATKIGARVVIYEGCNYVINH